MSEAPQGDGNDSYEVLNCREFYPKFLDPISEDVRRDLISVIHGLSNSGSSSENARERCEEIMLRVETELGVNNFICEAVAKELSECLRKLCLLTDCEKFLNNRIERIKTRDFGSLMILASIFELSGDYPKALKLRQETLKFAELKGDPILISLVLVKQACDLWNLHRPEEGKENTNKALELLKDARRSHIVETFPFDESTHRQIDLYKTLGYVHRFLGDRSESAEYYIKALDIVQQDKEALVHILKLETQIGCEYSNSRNDSKNKACEYSMRAYQTIKDTISNEDFMLHHSLTIVHALSRVAHTIQEADGKVAGVLPIREYLYTIAERYLGQIHPDVARIAADTAYFCNITNNAGKESEYLEKAKTALENNESIMDVEFMKLHVREIGDAWKTIGLLYSNRRDFSNAENAYNKAQEVNTRVYGLEHPRQARLYRSLGAFYRRFNKFSEASSWFRKCKDVNDKFYPNDTKLRKQLQKEISICKNLASKAMR